MNTISPHLATVLAAQHLSQVRLSAASQVAPRAVWFIAVTLMILVSAVLAAVARAARALGALMADFLQVAAAMTSVLLVMVISAVVIVVLLVHH